MSILNAKNEKDINVDGLLDSLNDRQLSAVTHGDGPQIIVAGAGTGKTMVVTKRIAWLVATGRAKPDQILALTFTDKSAEEMEERVDRLMPMGYVDLWISTFHSFCQRILQEYGLQIGLPNDFHLLNEIDQYLLVRSNFSQPNAVNDPTKQVFFNSLKIDLNLVCTIINFFLFRFWPERG